MPDQALQALENARQAIKNKEPAEARLWAQKAANLAPDQEEPWLILAASSNPSESIFYLKKALEINPASHKARSGMKWAVQRLRKRNLPGNSDGTDLDPPNGNGGNGLHDRWNQVARHWILLLVIAVVAGAIGWGASYIKSEEYEASATALIRSDRIFGGTGANATQFNAAEAEILSQAIVSFFRSRPVAEKVVQALHLDVETPITEPIQQLRHEISAKIGQAKDFVLHGYVPEADPYETAIKTYQENIVAAPIFQSNLLVIQAKASDPKIAAAIANQSVATFLEYANALYGSENSDRLSYLDQQLVSAKTNMEQARLVQLNFQQANHIANLEQEINARLNIVLELENDLNTTKGDIASLNTQLGEIKTQIGDLALTIQTRQEGTSDTTETGKASSSSSSSSSSSDKSGSTSSGKTNDTRSSNTVQTTVITETNPLYISLLEEQLKMERTIPDLEERQSLLETAIASQRKYIEDLSTINSTMKQLDQEYVLASNFYNNLRVQREQAVLDEAFPIDEVRQIDYATPPLYPIGPIRVLYAAIGAVLGLFGGVLLVILRQSWLQRKTRPVPSVSGDSSLDKA